MRGAGLDMPDSKFNLMLQDMGLAPTKAYAAEEEDLRPVTPSKQFNNPFATSKVTGKATKPTIVPLKPVITNIPFVGAEARSGATTPVAAVSPAFGTRGQAFGQASYAGRSPIHEVAREIFSGTSVMTAKYNRDELETEFSGYVTGQNQAANQAFTQEVQEQRRIFNLDTMAAYSKAEREAKASGGYLDITKEQFVAESLADFDRQMAAQKPVTDATTTSLYDDKGKLVFRGNKENYVKWRLSQEPSTKTLGKEYGKSMAPVYGTYLFQEQVNRGKGTFWQKWTPKNVGLLTLSVGADILTIVPPIGAAARAGVAAKAGLVSSRGLGASRIVIAAKNLKAITPAVRIVKPTVKGVIGGAKTFGKEYWQSLKYPFTTKPRVVISGLRTAGSYMTGSLTTPGIANTVRGGAMGSLSLRERLLARVGKGNYSRIPSGYAEKGSWEIKGKTPPMTEEEIARSGQARYQAQRFAAAKRWQKSPTILPYGIKGETVNLPQKPLVIEGPSVPYKPDFNVGGGSSSSRPSGASGGGAAAQPQATTAQTRVGTLLKTKIEVPMPDKQVQVIRETTVRPDSPPTSKPFDKPSPLATPDDIEWAQTVRSMTPEQAARVLGAESPLIWAVSGIAPITRVGSQSLPMSPGITQATPIVRTTGKPIASPTMPSTKLYESTRIGALASQSLQALTTTASATKANTQTKTQPVTQTITEQIAPPGVTLKSITPNSILPKTPMPKIKPVLPKPIIPIPPPSLPGLGGGGMAATTSYQPTSLGTWEFGYAFAGTDPITGKVRKIKFRKSMRYGNVPTKVMRSRISGQVNSDSPYYKREYIA